MIKPSKLALLLLSSLLLLCCKGRNGSVAVSAEAEEESTENAIPAKLMPGDIVPESRLDDIGSFFRIEEISDSVFTMMQGKSYKEDCIVPREDLRYITCLHKDKDGNSIIGEMVLDKSIAQTVLSILRELYDASYPIEKMRLIDNWDGDDDAAMLANNSSGFNFRKVSRTRTLSKHAYGLAVDINPYYNPYYKVQSNGNRIIKPEESAPYLDRSGDCPYMIRRDDLCCRLFKEKGFVWGGGWANCKDYQHFEKP